MSAFNTTCLQRRLKRSRGDYKKINSQLRGSNIMSVKCEFGTQQVRCEVKQTSGTEMITIYMFSWIWKDLILALILLLNLLHIQITYNNPIRAKVTWKQSVHCKQSDLKSHNLVHHKHHLTAVHLTLSVSHPRVACGTVRYTVWEYWKLVIW